MARSASRAWLLGYLLPYILLLALAACAGGYDEEADRSLSAVQQRIDRHIVALRTYADPNRRSGARRAGPAPAGTTPSPGWVAGPSYAESETHYGDVDSALQVLEARYRVMTAAGSQDQVAALGGVRAIAASMAEEHRRADRLDADYLDVTRLQFLGVFSSLLTFQRVLRPSR